MSYGHVTRSEVSSDLPRSDILISEREQVRDLILITLLNLCLYTFVLQKQS
jgi:hypothetical protein